MADCDWLQTRKDAVFSLQHGGFPGSMCGVPRDGRRLYSNRARNLGLRGTGQLLAYEALQVDVKQDV